MEAQITDHEYNLRLIGEGLGTGTPKVENLVILRYCGSFSPRRSDSVITIKSKFGEEEYTVYIHSCVPNFILIGEGRGYRSPQILTFG